MKKICSGCKKEKDETLFNFRNRSKGTRHSYCAECGKLKTQKHYISNKEYYKTKARKNDAIYYQQNRAYLGDYLKNNPCVDCGESDSDVLEFDHVRGEKINCISYLLNSSTIVSLKKEIEKCEVRCANCHRRKTIKQFGHFSYNAPVA